MNFIYHPLTLLLGIFAFLYFRKRAECKKLTEDECREKQECALPQTPGTPCVTNDEGAKRREQEQPAADTIKCYELMRQICRLIEREQLYKNPGLSPAMLADRMGMKQKQISYAVNQATGTNFKTLINEYRAKEAAKLLADPACTRFSIEGIAMEAGFNDRVTFYRAFKKCMGMSPTEFKKNRKTTEQ